MKPKTVIPLVVFIFLICFRVMQELSVWTCCSDTSVYQTPYPYPTPPPLPPLPEIPQEYLYLFAIILVTYVILSSIVKRDRKQK